jgi:hypothetical protein
MQRQLMPLPQQEYQPLPQETLQDQPPDEDEQAVEPAPPEGQAFIWMKGVEGSLFR